MSKYSFDQKLDAVLKVTEQHMSCLEVSKQMNTAYEHVRRWVLRYKQYGQEGLIIKHGSYPGEFKISVIEYMHKNHLSLSDASVKFGIPTDVTVGMWERIYYEQGPEALNRNNRGRKKFMNTDKSKRKKQLDSKTEEDLIAEVQPPSMNLGRILN